LTPEEKREREYRLLDPKLVTLIGHAASQWAMLEYYINDTIWSLSDTAPTLGACSTAQIYTIDGRLKALLSLLKLRRASKSLIVKVNKFAENMRAPSEYRNRLVHDPWGKRVPTGQTVKIEITANKKLRFENRVVDLKDLQKQVDVIVDVMLAFVEIRDTILNEIPTLPKMSQKELRPIVEGPRLYR
jgi:hypothetical protein